MATICGASTQVPAARLAQYLEAVRQLDELAKTRFDRRVIHLAVRWMLDQGISVALWAADTRNRCRPRSELRVGRSATPSASGSSGSWIPLSSIQSALSSWRLGNESSRGARS